MNTIPVAWIRATYPSLCLVRAPTNRAISLETPEKYSTPCLVSICDQTLSFPCCWCTVLVSCQACWLMLPCPFAKKHSCFIFLQVLLECPIFPDQGREKFDLFSQCTTLPSTDVEKSSFWWVAWVQCWALSRHLANCKECKESEINFTNWTIMECVQSDLNKRAAHDKFWTENCLKF